MMHRERMVTIQAGRWLCLAGLVLLGLPTARSAAGMAEWLPATTRQYLSVVDAARFRQAWERTGYAKMFANEGLKELVDESTRRGLDGLQLGLTRSEVQAAAGGEMAWATVEIGPRQRARVFAVDTTGKKSDGLVKTIRARLEKDGYTLAQQEKDGLTVVSASGPGSAQRAFAVKGNVLLCSDHVPTLLALVSPGKETLAGKKAYQAVRRDSGADGKEAAEVFVYLEPIALAQLNQEERKTKGTSDPLRTAREQGFDGIEALGGVLRLGREGADLSYRFAVYAPPPRKKALQMIQLEAGKEFQPPAWASSDAALAGVVYLDPEAVFRHVGGVFDAVYAPKDQGTFDEIIKRLRDDPNGPQVDIPREIVGRLGKRMVVVSRAPEGGEEQLLLALEARETESVARALVKLYENDEEVRRRQVRDHVVWVVPQRQSRRSKTAPARKAPDLCLCAARGHLYVANQFALLESALKATKGGLASEADHQRVVKELERVAPSDSVLRTFSRPDLDMRSAYETLRKGEKAEASNSIYAMVLRQVLTGANEIPREKAPPFEKLRPYLGPSGMWAANTATGWVIGGFSLRRER